MIKFPQSIDELDDAIDLELKKRRQRKEYERMLGTRVTFTFTEASPNEWIRIEFCFDCGMAPCICDLEDRN